MTRAGETRRRGRVSGPGLRGAEDSGSWSRGDREETGYKCLAPGGGGQSVSCPQNSRYIQQHEAPGECSGIALSSAHSSLFQSVILALSCVFACLLLTPSEADPAPSPAPAPQALESLLLAKLLFLKGEINTVIIQTV